MIDLKDQEQANYTVEPTAVDLSVIIKTYNALLAGDNLPERVAVQTVILQTLLDAAAVTRLKAKPVDVASWSQDLLAAWDQQYSCRQRVDEAKALSDKLILAACFAGIAYDAAMSLPIMEDKAPEFLLRIFLIALVDQNNPELDPYRAINRPQATTLTAALSSAPSFKVKEPAVDLDEVRKVLEPFAQIAPPPLDPDNKWQLQDEAVMHTTLNPKTYIKAKHFRAAAALYNRIGGAA